MVSTFSPNIQLEEPGRGDDLGVWDTPVNSNMTTLDLTIGSVTTIGLNNSGVVLTSVQFKSAVIVFNSTLTGDVAITFPTSFVKSYTIRNACTGSSAFVITLATTAAATQTITAPPGQSVDVYADGTSLNYRNLIGPVGTYWDYAGSSVPRWVSQCTVPPLLNCDGSVIASSIYSLLPIILGSSLLPDQRGRARFALDQGTGRISSAVFSSSLVGGSGGAQTTTLSSLHLPKLSDPGHTHTTSPTAAAGFIVITNSGGSQFFQGGASAFNVIAASIVSATTGITYGSSSQIAVPAIPPAVIGGLTMIRAG